ncbi:hypothetical protein [Mycolicibacterium llatzerense]|uniref:hypothetical protein n=1 Tax=Mycolicibacterium llatzerense TaxID=280871 RepID=UPI0021B5D2E7|nr:hypothetical protein [Mycolicibacterium llatzerense]
MDGTSRDTPLPKPVPNTAAQLRRQRTPPQRERVKFADADLVADRVRRDPAAQHLRGARRWVLAAVLTLLCDRWSKVTDRRMRLSQVSEEISESRGRGYHLKTLGRALAGLAADQLVTYEAAQGRGGFAVVAIHPRFLRDIDPLQRDESGQVIVESVTFSEPSPYIGQKKNLPTLQNSRTGTSAHPARPTGVDVCPEELRQVLGALGPSLSALPRHLRWSLGGAIRTRLARGFTPEQILTVLHAPEPAGLQRPWKLAMWRLAHNCVGSGPRLRPLQAAWDRRERAAERARVLADTDQRCAEVYALTTVGDREKLLRAHVVMFDAVVDPAAALANAARRARMLFPGSGLKVALMCWADAVLATVSSPEVSAPAAGADLVAELVAEEGCVQCGEHHGVIREQMPLPVPVCDTCWEGVRADFDDTGHSAAAVV